MKDWLEDLMDEYPTNRSERAVVRLARVFADQDDDVMRPAVDKYLREQQFFPKVADLKPYVDWARENRRGAVAYEDIGVQGPASPAELLAFEQARGTMPADDQLGTDYLEWR